MTYPDDSDRASHLEELERQHLLEKVPRSATRMTPTGLCYFCDETVADNMVFCDTDCRDWYQHEQDDLHKFYGVESGAALIAAQQHHIEKLQARMHGALDLAPQRPREG